MTLEMSSPELLNHINSPVELRQLPESKLTQVAAEIRQHLLSSLNQIGGHFGANLGSVEITIALHYLFNTPHDRLIWDVGHQAYPHKILTGRRDQLHTIKQTNGLSPFPKRSESKYDAFGTGHSSTSIGAAVGMAVANQLNQGSRHVVAVIGDGGLTGGMALEALNHAGDINPNLLIILNDNNMSISENVGALTKYFARILSGQFYCSARQRAKQVLLRLPQYFGTWAKKTERHLKGMVQPGTFFEELGIRYFGPIDGHNIPLLLKTIRTLKPIEGVKLLHIKTVKGKGFAAAEQNQIQYHAVKAGFLNPQKKTTVPKPPTYANVFGQWLCDTATVDQRLIGITPAMREGSDLVQFHQQFPNRYFDVCIAEQHAVTFAAGLACEGKKPVVAIYSTFLQRAYDQLIHDVAIQDLDVTFAIDRAGLVGPDGATHAGSFDLSFLRCIPNLIVMAPADENDCRCMLTTAYQYPGPAAVRYPRGTGCGTTVDTELSTMAIGKAELCREGNNIVLLAFGSMLQPALQAGEQLNATVVNMRFIKPLDKALLDTLTQTHHRIVTLEENSIMGGAGSAIAEHLQQVISPTPLSLLLLGLPDHFSPHGDRGTLLSQCQLDTVGIIKQIQAKWPDLVTAPA